MSEIGIIEVLAALGAGCGLAVFLVALWVRSNRPTAATARALIKEAEDSIAFLFDDEELIDSTPRARGLLNQSDSRRSDWDNFLTLLSARFPHLRSQCRDLAKVGKKSIHPRDGAPGVIEAEYWNGLARFTLIQDKEEGKEPVDPMTAAAMEHELQTLRSIGENSPQLIWKRDAEGILVWANRAYIELSEALSPPKNDGVRPWPPHNIFGDAAVPEGHAPIIDMHRVDVPGEDRPIWYEVTSLKRDTDTMYFAVDASASVYAQDAQRNFVQTLTKTFAQLSVGLAIFDADRRLVMFNPAMLELTKLPADFLISRPTLFSFLDRLRDTNMIPEPKDYRNWRDQMAALETAAREGSYHENWILPGGQTFRVTGRPHPNGAIAFLIEDISDEVSLTQKFRSQIDVSAAVIENMPVSVAVFSSSGSLLMANKVYRDLWGGPAETMLGDADLLEELDKWEASSAPSPVWHKLRETFAHGGADTAWSGTIWHTSNFELMFEYSLLPDNNHMITFSTADTALVGARGVEKLEFSEARSAAR